VKKVVLACFVILLFIREAGAESVNPGSSDLQSNLALLSVQCGYALDKNISDRVVKSSSTVSDKVVSVDLYIDLSSMPAIQGKLSFSCLAGALSASPESSAQRTTAADEIALEDSGGRYARNIVWQRKYEGDGWGGTVAYVNFVSGDQSKQPIPDYFLICPDKNRLACFSFEVGKRRLKKQESDLVPEFLHGISLSNSHKTVPNSPDKE